MQFSTTTLGFLAATLATVSAQTGASTITVEVGNGGLVYQPNQVTAAAGTAIQFNFFPKNHTVTQSSFSDPCHPLAGGFFSGFVPTASANGSSFTITLKDTKPVWVYCGQPTGNHCQSGMVMAINAPATGNTFAAFKALASNATLSTSPASGPVGGVLNIVGVTPPTSNSTTTLSNGGSGTILTTVTASVLTTVTTTVSKADTTYATTYATSVGTTYTTSVSTTASSTTSVAAKQSGSSGDRMVVSGVIGGVVAVAGFMAML